MRRHELSPGEFRKQEHPSSTATEIGKVYARWRLALLRTLGRGKAQDTPAEDALHDAVVRCIAANAPLANPDEARAYLHKAVINGVVHDTRERNAGRVLKTVPFDEDDAEIASLSTGDDADPFHIAEQRQRLSRLQEALNELPERQREAFVLHRFDGMTQDEVAVQMDISRRMVVKHLARAVAYCEVRVQYSSAQQMREHHPAAGDSDEEQDSGDQHHAAEPR